MQNKESDRKNDRITILLGAGAMLDMTPLSCKYITNEVISKNQHYFSDGNLNAIPLLNILYEHLKTYYPKEQDSVNFEDIFHTLEMWNSVLTSKNEQAIKPFRSILGMLCDIKKEYDCVNGTLIYSGMNDLVNSVIENVAKYETDVHKQENSWFSSFFRDLQKQHLLDIFTLNYDTWMEQILEDFNDGFIPYMDTHQKFSPNYLFENSMHLSTINHLHGQICFTSHLPNGSMRLLTDGWYKANSYDIIASLKIYPKHPSFMQQTQAAEQLFQYPIITGMRKTDKVTLPPFDAYLHHLYQKLLSNNKLLIIGYGFGDLYINSLIKQFRDFHGKEGKVTCINFLNPNEWVYNFSEMPLSTNMKQCIYRLFDDSDLPHRFLGSNFLSYIDTLNQKSRLYLCGFKTTVVNYRDDIYEFFA